MLVTAYVDVSPLVSPVSDAGSITADTEPAPDPEPEPEPEPAPPTPGSENSIDTHLEPPYEQNTDMTEAELKQARSSR